MINKAGPSFLCKKKAALMDVRALWRHDRVGVGRGLDHPE
jgi:hypothetical protein